MPKIDWDKWNKGWAFGLPKNQMWGKIRDGGNNAAGEPTYSYQSNPNHDSADPKLADVLAEHRFVVPMIGSIPGNEHCFCGWSGSVHADHLRSEVENFSTPEVVKAAPKQAKKTNE